MEDVLKGETGALFLFLYLLPGFLGAVVYDYLVERQPPSNFDRIVEALVLTLSSSLAAHVGLRIPLLPDIHFSKDTPLTEVLGAFLGESIVYVSIIAAVISLIFAILNNHKIIYRMLNRLGLTYKNGDDDVWQDTFYKHRKFWIGIKFQDGSVLIGWPQYYSPSGKAREIFVADATWWMPDEQGGLASADVAGAGVYLSDFSKVVAIEILEGVT